MRCFRCQQELPTDARSCPVCAEVAGSFVPPFRGLEAVLAPIARIAARLCEARDAMILLVAEGRLRLMAHEGPLPTPLRLGETAAQTTAKDAQSRA
jgi:RNA polymerase subunit RPABC4/transcription elongation factor Spt4